MLASLLLLLLSLGLCLALALQREPSVPPSQGLSPADIQRSKDFLRRNDPRRLAGGGPRQLRVDEAQLNLLLNQLAQRYGAGQGGATVALQQGQAALQASVRLPRLGAWLNIDARLLEGGHLPEIASLHLGRLPLPGWLARWALRRLIAQLETPAQTQLARDMIERISFAPKELHLAYRWRSDSMEQLLGSLWSAAEQDRVRAYNEQLIRWVQAQNSDAPVSLARLLPPLFELARQRSALPAADAAQENRSAVLTLALYACGQDWGRLLPAARLWPHPPLRRVTLAGRDDFAQHFMVSAALALEGGGPLADAIGVYKEVADARGGSGFSFNDIAADRAGSRFGLLARQSPGALQALLRSGLQEHDFMPDVADLPEFLSPQAFAQRYGGLDQPAYRQMMATIEARIERLPLLQHGI